MRRPALVDVSDAQAPGVVGESQVLGLMVEGLVVEGLACSADGGGGLHVLRPTTLGEG